jgi:hypothetical protein
MKSEERHKLQQNSLAEWLNQTFTAIKPYQNAILAVMIVLILAMFFAFWWSSESAAQSGRTWTAFFTAFNENNPAALEKVADDNPSSRAAPVADIVAADLQLAQGCNMLFVNKPTANQQLNKAVELYQLVITRSSSSTLRAQATLGLAKALEALGKLPEATSTYSQVKTDWPDTVFDQMASRRLDDLKRISTKELYDKFARFEPRPSFNQPQKSRSDLEKIPDEGPVYNTPGVKSGLDVDEKKTPTTDGTGGADKPQEKAEKPADAQNPPAESKPAQ